MHKILLMIGLTALLCACSSSTSADLVTSNAVDASANTPTGIAIRTIAEQIGASPEQITIRSEEAVEFSDSSLGCPKSGMSYMQVITPGHKVLAEYGGKIYDVRVAGSRGLICVKQATTSKKR
jgi:hypothetical protein